MTEDDLFPADRTAPAPIESALLDPRVADSCDPHGQGAPTPVTGTDAIDTASAAPDPAATANNVAKLTDAMATTTADDTGHGRIGASPLPSTRPPFFAGRTEMYFIVYGKSAESGAERAAVRRARGRPRITMRPETDRVARRCGAVRRARG